MLQYLGCKEKEGEREETGGLKVQKLSYTGDDDDAKRDNVCVCAMAAAAAAAGGWDRWIQIGGGGGEGGREGDKDATKGNCHS